jgi:predicted dehydrogenase
MHGMPPILVKSMMDRIFCGEEKHSGGNPKKIPGLTEVTAVGLQSAEERSTARPSAVPTLLRLMHDLLEKIPAASRRSFLTTSAAVGGALVFPSVTQAAPNGGKLKIGCIGFGGRGSGAVDNTLTADSNSELWAVADLSGSTIEAGLGALKGKFGDRLQVAPERQFTGMDGFKQVLASGVDLVILATPPGFRPAHLAAAVEAGKHIFCEKPMAVDATGVRSVMESVRKSKEKGLTLVAGYCWRYCTSRQEVFKAIHDGAIGEVQSYYGTYLTGPVKPMPPASSRPADMSDVEWQVRNWYNFSWLSGDGYVEQCIHTVDKLAWLMKEKPPIACTATGGRQSASAGGNIYDHMTVVYEYEGGVLATVAQRQTPNCFNENADYITGSTGRVIIKGASVRIEGAKPQRFKEDNDDMYVQEHRDLWAALRAGQQINDGERMATSTLLGIMGRMAAYSGTRVTWEQAMNSKEDLAPEETLTLKSAFTPMERPVPGVYKLA